MLDTRLFPLAGLVLLVAGCGFGKQSQIDEYVKSEKATLPKIMFSDVTVVDIESGESEIVYFCDAQKINPAVAEAAKSQMIRKAELYVKDHKSELGRIINNKIKMTFVARKEASTELFRFTLKPWEL